jgi:hypothetical protein
MPRKLVRTEQAFRDPITARSRMQDLLLPESRLAAAAPFAFCHHAWSPAFHFEAHRELARATAGVLNTHACSIATLLRQEWSRKYEFCRGESSVHITDFREMPTTRDPFGLSAAGTSAKSERWLSPAQLGWPTHTQHRVIMLRRPVPGVPPTRNHRCVHFRDSETSQRCLPTCPPTSWSARQPATLQPAGTALLRHCYGIAPMGTGPHGSNTVAVPDAPRNRAVAVPAVAPGVRGDGGAGTTR